MLTDLVEGNNKPKADQYWPDKENEHLHLSHGIFIKYLRITYQGEYLQRYVIKILTFLDAIASLEWGYESK